MGFAWRTLEDEGQRYCFPPKDKLDRTLELWNLHRALKRSSKVIVAEGFFTCLNLWQHGYNAVARLRRAPSRLPWHRRLPAGGKTMPRRQTARTRPPRAGQGQERELDARQQGKPASGYGNLSEDEEPQAVSATEARPFAWVESTARIAGLLVLFGSVFINAILFRQPFWFYANFLACVGALFFAVHFSIALANYRGVWRSIPRGRVIRPSLALVAITIFGYGASQTFVVSPRAADEEVERFADDILESFSEFRLFIIGKSHRYRQYDFLREDTEFRYQILQITETGSRLYRQLAPLGKKVTT